MFLPNRNRASSPANASRQNYFLRPQLVRVMDRVYCGINYALCGVLNVITDSNVVVIARDQPAGKKMEESTCLRCGSLHSSSAISK
jgi:hypothetical protein